jgi:hypothetical protein
MGLGLPASTQISAATQPVHAGTKAEARRFERISTDRLYLINAFGLGSGVVLLRSIPQQLLRC